MEKEEGKLIEVEKSQTGGVSYKYNHKFFLFLNQS